MTVSSEKGGPGPALSKRRRREYCGQGLTETQTAAPPGTPNRTMFAVRLRRLGGETVVQTWQDRLTHPSAVGIVPGLYQPWNMFVTSS